jgi:CHAD domain-containing protein
MLHPGDVTPSEPPTAGCPIDLLDFLRRSLKKQWRDYRNDFARCRRKFSEKSVHQFRIESRRLLSTLSVLRAIVPRRHLDAAHRALKKRLRVFACLRDTHVQLLAIEELAHEFPQLAPFRKHLAKRDRRLTKRIARKLKRARLRSVAKPVALIGKDLRRSRANRDQEQKELPLVVAALEASFESVAERFRAIDPSNPTTIHRTRVAFKEFRYMAEALQPVLPGATDRVIDRMRDYQARMGEIQDAKVLRASLEKYLAKAEESMPDAVRIRVELERRKAALMQTFLNQADELFSFAPSKLRTTANRPRRGAKHSSR